MMVVLLKSYDVGGESTLQFGEECLNLSRIAIPGKKNSLFVTQGSMSLWQLLECLHQGRMETAGL